MQFENNTIYHIYNQGNNKQQTFFTHENYLFFLRKVREYLLPHGKMLCYCLMPNHFHFLMYVESVEIEVKKKPLKEHEDTEKNSSIATQIRTFNDSIGILLRSYTRAINVQENRTGSLFRKETKAKNGIIEEFITVKNSNSQGFTSNKTLTKSRESLLFGSEMNYEATCFQYIHQNPVLAKLVKHSTDCVYSSAQDYAGMQNGMLCNQAFAKSLGVVG